MKKIILCLTTVLPLTPTFADGNLSSVKTKEVIKCDDHKHKTNKKDKVIDEQVYKKSSYQKKNIFNKEKGITCSETKEKNVQEQVKSILGT